MTLTLHHRAEAYMNHGRWVVQCPNVDCVGAERLEPGRSTVVCRCSDTDVCSHGVSFGGRVDTSVCATVIEVSWPAQFILDRLAELMAARPVLNRNWYPYETVEQIEAENAAHGVPVVEV